MKMFKRLAAVLLAGVMALAMLTACGGADSTEQKVIDAFNKAAGTSLSNSADLCTKVRPVLYTVKDGELKVANLPSVTQGKQTLYNVSDVSSEVIDDKTLAVTGTYYIFSNDDITADVETVKALKADDVLKEIDQLTDLDDIIGEAMENVTFNAIGVETLRAADGNTYIGIAVTITYTATIPTTTTPDAGE